MRTSVVAAVVIIIVVASLVYYFLVFKSNQTPVGQANTMTSLDVAKTITSYIGTQRNSDGFYNWSYNCPAGQTVDNIICPSNVPQADMWTSLAYTSMFEATGNSAYLSNATRDVDVFINWCNTNSNNMQQCLWTLIQANELYGATKDAKYLNFVSSAAGQLLSQGIGVTMMRGIEAREFATAYELTNNATFLNESLSRLNDSMYLGNSGIVGFQFNNNNYYTFSCWPMLAQLELFKATGNSAFVSNVTSFADSLDFGNNVAFLSEATDIQPCADMEIQLFHVTNNTKYLNASNSMIQYLLNNFWDSSYSPKVSGKGDFLHERGQIVDTLTDASYMVYLLTQVKDSKFVVS